MASAQDRRAFPLPGSQAQYGPDHPLRVLHVELELWPDLERRTIDGVCTTLVEAIDDDVNHIVLGAVGKSRARLRAPRRDAAGSVSRHAAWRRTDEIFD